MKRVILTLAIIAICASQAWAVAFGVLDSADPRETLSQTNHDNIYTDLVATQKANGIPYDVAYTTVDGNGSAVGNNYGLVAGLHFTNQTEIGFAARGDLDHLDAYAASLNPTNGYLALVKIIGGGSFVNLDIGKVQGFDASNDYTLGFDVQGSNLAAYLWDQTGARCTLYDGQSGPRQNTYVDSLIATDSTYTSGVVGMFMFKHAAPVEGQWNNARILSTIPEPGTAAISIAGALALLGWAGLRRRGQDSWQTTTRLYYTADPA
jgi:hypothetical protein